MATKDKKETKGSGNAPKSGGKKKGEAPKARGPHAGADKPAPAPRLRVFYQSTVRQRLMDQFGLKNPHQVPTLTKIVLNVGAGEAIKQPKFLDSIVEELATITGQQPVRRKAKKSISNFGLRQGVPVGVAVTLRGPRMYEFLDRFISLAVPRIRDFRGLPNRSFDGRGNYSFGIKEQLIFPEIDYDRVEKIHGMDITIVTTAGRDDLALALLREFGWPFRGETPKSVSVSASESASTSGDNR